MVVGLKERRRVEPEVFAPIDGPLASEYRRCGIRVHIGTHPLRHSEQGVDPFTMMTQFGRWARERLFDAIAANTLETFWAVHAAKMVDMPAIWIVRESVDPRQHFRVLGGLAPTALETFSLPYRVVFVAKATRKLMQEYDHRHSFEVIHNSLRLAAIEPFRAETERIGARSEIDAGPAHIVFAIHGTTCPRKGQLDFARAAVRLLESGRRNLLFLIVGCRPGEYLDRIRTGVARHGDSFRLMPESDGALRMLAASDIFVCCSQNESYPRVVLEALALGKPIVTTTVFGIAEQVTPNFSALTFDPGDVDALAAHMARLADDPTERRRLADGAAIEWAGLASYDEMIERHERLIREAALTGRAVDNLKQWSKLAA